MQLPKRTIEHGKQRHDNTEENRIGQHGKNSLGKLSFCGYKEYCVLTHKRKDKSNKELQRPIGQHKFCVEQKRCLQHNPSAPNDIGGLFAVFERGGIDAGSSMRYQ
jgi:hypothetical protein